MGRKPVVGLVGAWLASLALAGCDSAPTSGGSKKDTVPPNNSSTNTAWNQPRQPQGNATGSGTGVTGINERPAGFSGGQPTGTTGTAGVGTGSNTGNTTGGSSRGGAGGNPWTTSGGSSGAGAGTTGGVGGARGPMADYPTGHSGDSQFGAGSSNVERSAYPGTDPNGGRVTSPTTTGNTGRAPGGNGLPPLSGSQSPTHAPTLADLSAQEPVTGQAIPRIQDIPPAGPTGRGPAASSGTATGRDLSGTGTSTALPPPVPPPSSLMGGGGSDPSLPALPATPTPSSTTSFQRPPSGARLGMPANPTANPAVMQPGAPSE